MTGTVRTSSKGGGEEVKKLDFVDALRGWAFLGVLLVHAGFGFPIVSRWTEFGIYGVQLFFVASAFTLCLSWHQRAGRDRRPIRDFMLRRFFRIAPMFWFGILAYEFIPGRNADFPREVLHAPHFFLTAIFAHGWYPATINSVVPGGWSIAAEFAFYALFPWIIYRCKSWEATFGWLAVAQVCSLVWNGWVVPILTRSIFAEFNRDQMWSFGYFGFPSQLPVFLVGILAYHAFSLTRSRHLERSAGWTFIIIAFVLMVSFKDFTLVRLIPRHVAFSFEFALLLLGLSIHPTRLLVNAVTCQLGRISFSAYLVHFAVLHGMSTLLSGLGDQPSFFRSDAVRFVLLVVTSLLLTAAVASVTYRLIEQPGISLGRWIIRRLEKQSPAGSLYGS